MCRHILICEGDNDTCFFHETLTNILMKSNEDIFCYDGPRKLENDIRQNRQKKISILRIGGYRGCIRFPIRFSRRFWAIDVPLKFGIIIDGPKKRAFNNIVKYLKEFMATPCKKHNVHPSLYCSDSKCKLTLSFEKRKDMSFWVQGIPNSLEIQIARVLKNKYPELRKYTNEYETIRGAQNMLRKSKEEIIRMSVQYFKGKKWFVDLCKEIENNLKCN